MKCANIVPKGFILITLIIITIVAIYFIYKAHQDPQSASSINPNITTDIFSSKGKTVLNSQGEIGWHLKDKLCADGSTPELAQTSDPRIFGPIIWPGLHIMAENYPEKADKAHKKACVQFLEGLPWMLPCGHCGSHLLKRESSAGEESIEDLLKDEEAKITKKKNLRKACNGRKHLRTYLVGAHNKVSQNNKKPIWTSEDAQKKYCQIPACLQKCSEFQKTQCDQSTGCVWNANEDTGEMECQAGWFEDGIPYPSGQSCIDEKLGLKK
ncbi:MAG: Erv1/Alr family FAD-linked sulfhydryl oxidase [Nitrospinales bacterium]|nr:Erv1/Alr family FAD-linked sulfhydryl oxidase [Nitrospinales bacterium]